MGSEARKAIKRFEIANHARGLTFSVYQRVRLLDRSEIAEVVLRAISEACAQQGWRVLAFVIMPDHVHLLVVPTEDPPDTPRLLSGIKRISSFRINRMLTHDEASRLTTPRGAFRLWQAGSGHDRNLWSREAILSTIEYYHANPVRGGLCDRPEEWRWSSCNQWMTKGYEVLEYEPRIARDLI